MAKPLALGPRWKATGPKSPSKTPFFSSFEKPPTGVINSRLWALLRW